MPNKQLKQTIHGHLCPCPPGELPPLSVYKSKGYSEQEIKNIEGNCEKEWNAVINAYTYKLAIKSSGTEEREDDINESSWGPAPSASTKSLKRQSSKASSDKGECSGAEKSKANKRRKTKKTADDKPSKEPKKMTNKAMGVLGVSNMSECFSCSLVW